MVVMVLDSTVIVEIERKIPLGITNPYIVKCSDDKKYVAKFPGNPDGTKVLINEYVCAKLAKLLGLPIPNYKLIQVNDILKYENALVDIDLVNGTAFCSEFIDKATNVPGYYVLTRTSNKYDAIKILIFDVIVGNNDRNPGNLLINLKNNSLVMIDHSHVFVYEALWNENNLSELIGSNIDLSKMNKFNFNNLSLCLNDTNYKTVILEYINRIKCIDDSKISNILNTIPEDWNITIREKEVLKEFLLDRLHRINEICALLNIEGGD